MTICFLIPIVLVACRGLIQANGAPAAVQLYHWWEMWYASSRRVNQLAARRVGLPKVFGWMKLILDKQMAAPRPDPSLRTLGNLLRRLKESPTRFSGLTLERAGVPDHIVFFQRTDPALLRSALGVSSNYHHRFELVVVFQSGGLATVGESTFELHPGECVLLFPHQFHRFENQDDQAIKWLFITFDLGDIQTVASLRDRPVVLDAKALSLLENLLAPRVHSPDDNHTALEVVYALSHFLRHLVTCRPIGTDRWKNLRVEDLSGLILEKVNAVVRTNLSDNPSIQELATRIGYSASYLRSVFRNELGISLGRYLRESRLAEAAKLLQLTNLQVTQIAEKAGFDSLVSFSRAFKNAYNLSPLAYAKLVRRGDLPATGRKAEW